MTATVQANSSGKVYMTSSGKVLLAQEGGSTPNIESLNVTPTTSSQIITATGNVNGYSPVNVAGVTSAIDSNIKTSNIKKDVVILGVTGSYEGSGGGGGGDVTLARVSDDNGNEIGTYYMDFVDSSNNSYKVIVLDAQYRNASTYWCSSSDIVTNMPIYDSNYNLWWYDNAMETATQNTQLILDYCSKTGFDIDSTSCSHCRSQSFTIDGTTYYGQLPNMREVFDMWRHRVQIEQMDTSASSHSSTNFSSARNIWSSSQWSSNHGLCLFSRGSVGIDFKAENYFACPVLEICN